MATRRPLRPIDTRGRAAASAVANATLLQKLTRFLPDLKESVLSAIKQAPPSLESAFADPEEIAAQIHELARKAGVNSKVPSVEAIKNELLAASPAESVSVDILEEEVEHTKAELVRCWFNCIRRAWSLWGNERGRVVLNMESLLPAPHDCPDALCAEWSQFCSCSNDALFASIALDETAKKRAWFEFAKNINTALNIAPVELPGKLCISKSYNKILIVSID